MVKQARIGSTPSTPTGKVAANPLPQRVLRFLGITSAKTMPMKFIDYRPAKLVKGTKRWYVEYYYRIPAELKPQYNNRQWERFRVFEDINRFKDDAYAAALVIAVDNALLHGYNPFEQKQIQILLDGGESEREVTIKQAIELFISEQKKKGLDGSTIRKYEQTAAVLQGWLFVNKLQDQKPAKIKRRHIEQVLQSAKEENAWGNRQYNNIKGMCYTIFEFFTKREWITQNPVMGVESLKTTATKYRYFDKKLFPKIAEIIQANDPYLWCAAQFVYYLAVRSSKELRLMKVGDILEDGELYLFRAKHTKSRRDDAIPIDPHLKEAMQQMGLFDARPTDYIFTAGQQPGPGVIGVNYFTKRFAKIRKLAGLGHEFSLYSFKHSRAVHLVKDGAKLSDVMRLFRHSSISTTAIYCRNLGLDFDAKDLQDRTRKI